MGLKRQKKMGSALLSLSRSVQELMEENQSLKEDLDRVLSNSPTTSKITGACRAPGAGHTGGGPGAGWRPWERLGPSWERTPRSCAE